MGYSSFTKTWSPMKRAFLLITSLAFLTACDGIRPGEPTPDPNISVFTGKPQGTPLDKLLSDDKSAGDGMPVNALLWRAALDIASFVPLDDVDTFGGTIVTEWYQKSADADKRLKLSFFVTGLELRSDTITVRAYLQTRQNNDWVDAGQDQQLARKLEDLTLTRARELRADAVAETAK